MTIDFKNGDDLSDLLGNGPAPACALPADETLTRIRETVPQFVETCPKCRGTGRFVGYTGRVFGQCFACKGRGSKTFKSSKETRMQNREKAADRKVALADSYWAGFAAEQPAAAEFLLAEQAKTRTGSDSRWADMIDSFIAGARKFGHLTPGQLGVVERAIERRAQKAQAAPAAAPTEFPQLRAAFDAVVQRGAKRAQITIGSVNVSLAASTGRNPGALYVKWNGEYAGKIVGTRFAGRNASPELVAALALIEVDPTKAIKDDAARRAERLALAKAEGREETVPCGCCGIELTDPVSVARGIGPICAGKWGF